MAVIVSVNFEAKSGKEKQLHELLTSLIAPSQKEAGCIQYDLHRHHEDPKKFMFYEIWTNKANLDAHAQSAHIKSAVAKIDDFLASPIEMVLWDKI